MVDVRGQDSETPESILIRHEENSMIQALIEALPDLFREVPVLWDVEDMPHRKIADITGVSACTVMPHLAGLRAMAAAAWNGRPARPSKEMLP